QFYRVNGFFGNARTSSPAWPGGAEQMKGLHDSLQPRQVSGLRDDLSPLPWHGWIQRSATYF
ncbi:MAG TPA: hypothetical protein VEC99_12445, partial [Clostridia bacterium]|nr:hypothetical protein [Clostridia bacterium]